MSLLKWRYPIETLTVEIGPRGFRTAHKPWPSEVFDLPFSYDAFTAGASDYDMSSDEIYCPCGVTLGSWDGSIGTALRMIVEHCVNAGHPQPVIEP